MSKIIGYARVSSDKQTTANQRLSILNYAQSNKLTIDDIIEVTTSSKKSRKDRQIDEVINILEDKDTLLIHALDRLGRSTIETLQIIEDIKEKGITLIIIKENLIIDPNNENPLNQMLLTMLTAVANLERSFISERTKLGLERRKQSGVKLGRQEGQQVKSIFDEHKNKIIELLDLGVTQKKIYAAIGVGTEASLGKYIKTRELRDKDVKPYKMSPIEELTLNSYIKPKNMDKIAILELMGQGATFNQSIRKVYRKDMDRVNATIEYMKKMDEQHRVSSTIGSIDTSSLNKIQF